MSCACSDDPEELAPHLVALDVGSSGEVQALLSSAFADDGSDFFSDVDSFDALDFGDESASYMSAWRMRLSVALLHGRVNLVHAAVDKLHGAPARTNTAAYRISHPLGFVRELGRLGRR